MDAEQRELSNATPNPAHCVLQIAAESRTIPYKGGAWPQTR